MLILDSTSEISGIEFCAPCFVVDKAAATTERFTVSLRSRPRDNNSATEPQNESPAPVVSTLSTAGEGTNSETPFETIKAPLLPKVVITVSTPRPLAASSTSSMS